MKELEEARQALKLVYKLQDLPLAPECASENAVFEVIENLERAIAPKLDFASLFDDHDDLSWPNLLWEYETVSNIVKNYIK
jgi:hypothetical protein